ncbi:MAG: hypothetical protein BMS9Abin32_361 [Gammaproteobacteria bacterium]|nr:MAG: hypothetical protein BMS9Abin32_361 [Gammaproteobacteria bacterium]
MSETTGIVEPPAGLSQGPGTDAAIGGRLFDASTIDHRRLAYDTRLERVRLFVEQRYAEPLPLDRVAQVAGLEKSYFSKYFHQKTGVCFHDWLHWIRVGHAIELMRSRELSVTEVAYAVGFQDLRTFERAFTRCTGQCPKTMKKQILADLRS